MSEAMAHSLVWVFEILLEQIVEIHCWGNFLERELFINVFLNHCGCEHLVFLFFNERTYCIKHQLFVSLALPLLVIWRSLLIDAAISNSWDNPYHFIISHPKHSCNLSFIKRRVGEQEEHLSFVFALYNAFSLILFFLIASFWISWLQLWRSLKRLFKISRQ